MRVTLPLLACCLWLNAAPLRAQTAGATPLSPPTPSPETSSAPPSTSQPAAGGPNGLLGNFSRSGQWRLEQISATHLRLIGQVEIEGNQVKFFADEIDLYTDTNRLVASGNVVFTNPEGRISAERVEFNTETGFGTFSMAFGIMSLGENADRTQFGNQDPDVYFYGATIEKVADRQYRITNGGFTTCVQPTPRWEVTSSSVTLNLDEYAIARSTVLRVKGVPIMYMPVIYYPIQDDGRATGFLLPTYGTSTLRGQSLSNAFFWALGRSHDATFFHDWFTRTGQGAGTEYRYVAGAQSFGNFRLYRFSQQETAFTDNGQVTVLPSSRSFELNGTATQSLGPVMRGRARLDYFSDIVTQQLYHQNVYQASRRSRLIEGSVSGTFGPLSGGALYQRNEVFNNERSSIVYGSTPRLTASVAPQRLFDLPFYGSLNSEYALLPYRYLTDNVVTRDNGLGRIDVSPTLRVPLSRLTFLSVNNSAAYRTTYYTRSLDARGIVVPEPFVRQYLGLRSEVLGPVLTRIWDLPASDFAERMKHVIEPAFALDYTTTIEDYRRTPVLSDASDFVVGGTFRFTYGLTNRFFYRGRPVDGQRGQTREFVTVGIQQTYYGNPESSQYDSAYASSSRGRPLDLSPIALTARVSPSSALDANTRLEYDVSGWGLQVFTTGASINASRSTANVSYSRRRLSKTSPADTYLSTSTTLRFLQGRASGTYALSWDIGRSTVVSQDIIASYMAQCCGLEAQFQRYTYPRVGSNFPIPADRRINFSFVLAGLGTFSNFFGAFGGQR
jgi:LPS-assembly protein